MEFFIFICSIPKVCLTHFVRMFSFIAILCSTVQQVLDKTKINGLIGTNWLWTIHIFITLSEILQTGYIKSCTPLSI